MDRGDRTGHLTLQSTISETLAELPVSLVSELVSWISMLLGPLSLLSSLLPSLSLSLPFSDIQSCNPDTGFLQTGFMFDVGPFKGSGCALCRDADSARLGSFSLLASQLLRC